MLNTGVLLEEVLDTEACLRETWYLYRAVLEGFVKRDDDNFSTSFCIIYIHVYSLYDARFVNAN